MNLTTEIITGTESHLLSEEACSSSRSESSVFLLDHVGEVTLNLDTDRLSWQLLHDDSGLNKKVLNVKFVYW